MAQKKTIPSKKSKTPAAKKAVAKPKKDTMEHTGLRLLPEDLVYVDKKAAKEGVRRADVLRGYVQKGIAADRKKKLGVGEGGSLR